MATKQEIIDGLNMVIRESDRIAARQTDEEWAMPAQEQGWSNKQMYAHIAGVGTIVIPFATALLNAPADGGGAGSGNVDINAINAGLVAARSDKSIDEIAKESAAAYSAVAEWVGTQPDEALERRVSFGPYKNMLAGDLLMQMVVMHGLAHLYQTAARM